MCFDDEDGRSTYKTKVQIRNEREYHQHQVLPTRGMSWRRRIGLGGSYYPDRYYYRPPVGRLVPALRHGVHARHGGYPPGVMPGGFQRGVAPGFQLQNQAMVPVNHGQRANWPAAYSHQTSQYAGGHALMPIHPAMRTYYNTVPSYGYATAHVYPPGPHTTTTTYHVTNAPAQQFQTQPQMVRETRPAFGPSGHPQQGFSREEIQMENRRVATARGAYDARKIRPADARDDDPFWCRELNGEWHLRSYYQIEMECQPGRWMMDADVGFLVFHRGAN
ncbi:hypothetical protein NX059_009962 [Plenodomus lindquistii]|nr:hypothetical protein NX059_009962 [Plenodomus lindquistii]